MMMSPISLNLSTHCNIFLPTSLIIMVSPRNVNCQGFSRFPFNIPSISFRITSKLDAISSVPLSMPRHASVWRSCRVSCSMAIAHRDRALVLLAAVSVASLLLLTCICACAELLTVIVGASPGWIIGFGLGVVFRIAPADCISCTGLGDDVRCSEESVRARVVELTPPPIGSTEVLDIPAEGCRLSCGDDCPDLKKSRIISRFLGFACDFCIFGGDRGFCNCSVSQVM